MDPANVCGLCSLLTFALCSSLRCCEKRLGAGMIRMDAAMLRLSVLTALSALAACTLIPGAPQQTVLSEKPKANGVLNGNAVMLPIADGVSSGSMAATTAVRTMLGELEYRIVGDAPYQVDVALAKRASTVGFHDNEDRTGIMAKPHDGRIDLCREHVFRLSVAVIERKTAAVVYRGVGEKVRCGDPDDADLRALARVALASLG